jgi:hypothetical protein
MKTLTESAKPRISEKIWLRLFGDNSLESFTSNLYNPEIWDFLIPIPAITIGPRIEPRPASSTPPIKISSFLLLLIN